MAYITQSDLVDRYGSGRLQQLTDRDGTAGAIVDAVIDRAIADVGAVIDGYLAARYALPVATVPPLLATLAGDLVLYRLYGETVPERVAADRKDALQTLRDISAGTVRLPLAAPDTGEAPSSGDSVQFAPGDRTMTDGMGAW